jgi:hypothetical protein
MQISSASRRARSSSSGAGPHQRRTAILLAQPVDPPGVRRPDDLAHGPVARIVEDKDLAHSTGQQSVDADQCLADLGGRQRERIDLPEDEFVAFGDQHLPDQAAI